MPSSESINPPCDGCRPPDDRHGHGKPSAPARPAQGPYERVPTPAEVEMIWSQRRAVR